MAGYGGFDYIFVAISDVMSTAGDPLYGQRTTPAGSAAWLGQVQEGCLNCTDKGFERIIDGIAVKWLVGAKDGQKTPTDF